MPTATLLDKLEAADASIDKAAGGAAGSGPGAPAPAPSPPVGGTKAPCAKKKKVKVVKINAQVNGTKSFHKPKTRKLPTDKLKSSSSSAKGLGANKPNILVRGCNEVILEAITSPAGKPVNWRVEKNENKEAPPSILPFQKGRKAKLRTDRPGSFSVIAEADGSEIVWNVVFVWVKVRTRTSVITGRKTGFVDNGSSPAATSFSSGVFAKGSDAFEAESKVQLIGGGSSGKLGIDKVELHILQDGTRDTLSGTYTAPPPNALAHEVPAGPMPILDTNGPGDPGNPPRVPAQEGGTLTPFVFVANSVTVTPNQTAAKRTIWTGDSPGGGFVGTHKFKGAAAASRLTGITGVNAFRTAIVSISTEAPNSIVAHADVTWEADFTGSVNPTTGVYTRAASAGVTHQKHYHLISKETGGEDAQVAGLEVFGPRFNFGLKTSFTP